jgi:hypothetical protein
MKETTKHILLREIKDELRDYYQHHINKLPIGQQRLEKYLVKNNLYISYSKVCSTILGFDLRDELIKHSIPLGTTREETVLIFKQIISLIDDLNIIDIQYNLTSFRNIEKFFVFLENKIDNKYISEILNYYKL